MKSRKRKPTRQRPYSTPAEWLHFRSGEYAVQADRRVLRVMTEAELRKQVDESISMWKPEDFVDIRRMQRECPDYPVPMHFITVGPERRQVLMYPVLLDGVKTIVVNPADHFILDVSYDSDLGHKRTGKTSEPPPEAQEEGREEQGPS